MKKIFMIFVIAVAASSAASAQMKMAKDTNNSVEAQVIALEKQGWGAWKNKDAAWYQANLAEDALQVNGEAF